MAADAGARSFTSYLPALPAPRHREGFDWLTHGRTLWRHKLFLASFVAAALSLTAVYDSRVPSTFEAESLVMLGEREVRADTPEALSAVRIEDRLQRELLEFRSPDMAERMVDQLNLHLRPEFNPELGRRSATLFDGLNLVRLAPAALIDRLPAALVDALAPGGVAVSDQQHAAALRAEIVERVRARIVAEPGDRPAVISVRFASSDPQLAALGANRLAALYLAGKAEAEQADALKARAFLEEEIMRLQAAIAEANIQSVKRQVAQRGPGNGMTALGLATRADRELLEIYRNRVREIASQKNAQVPLARIVSEAITPDQTTDPRRKMIFGIVLFGAFLVGAFAALRLDRLDNTVRNAEQLEDLVGLGVLATVPSIPSGSGWQKAPDRHVLDYPGSPFGSAVTGLRTAILRSARGGQKKTILLTSALAKEGKSVLAVSLARVHARSGARVLLVDCDLGRPRLQEREGAEEPGLGDVLLDHQSLEAAVHRDERSGAFLMTAGAAVPDTAVILASEAMRRVLSDATGAYDLVILDGPPVLAGSDARILAQLADRTIFLVQWGRTRRQDVVAATRLLIEAGADLAGAVLTRASTKESASHI